MCPIEILWVFTVLYNSTIGICGISASTFGFCIDVSNVVKYFSRFRIIALVTCPSSYITSIKTFVYSSGIVSRSLFISFAEVNSRVFCMIFSIVILIILSLSGRRNKFVLNSSIVLITQTISFPRIRSEHITLNGLLYIV
ncbi:hypothetical protein AR158_c649R [Paramecium bursaria Chlorella virus AR158]|uniref:hypothetical protein n=1 Tax=Paramecium bursaria Chlorella virus AR158 TaxID=380598 RepID=UPI00015AA804|nr:hypothetical protein AR158_c649R [Paramecium bursaria Chlorella virus AR158]ABU44194.1 hypothetical protein AR158_c649R [Paramecium bursaria Chlorella virus AR158]